MTLSLFGKMKNEDLGSLAPDRQAPPDLVNDDPGVLRANEALGILAPDRQASPDLVNDDPEPLRKTENEAL